jgi:hypothetical protein
MSQQPRKPLPKKTPEEIRALQKRARTAQHDPETQAWLKHGTVSKPVLNHPKSEP